MKAGPSMLPLAFCVLHSIDGGSWSALRNLSGTHKALWNAMEPGAISMGSKWGPLGPSCLPANPVSLFPFRGEHSFGQNLHF